jgi:hypothetical protein
VFYHELSHPWLYTRAELDAFNAMRHEEETGKWKKGEWKKGEWEVVEGWEVGESEGEE